MSTRHLMIDYEQPPEEFTLKDETGSTSKARSKEFKSSSVKRKQYSTAEISSLEAIFKSSKGHTSANIIERTAESLEIGEAQVKNYSLSCRPVF